MLKNLEAEIEKQKNLKQAKILQRFFKTGKGQYGEGDIFYGIKVPVLRQIAKKYIDISIQEAEKLLHSKVHEKRLIALFILTEKFKKGSDIEKKKIFKIYLKNTKYINNWDLIDLSAPKIVGEYLLNKDRKILYKLAKSKSLWEKRISILATFTFIAKNDFKDALKISEILLDDSHDLIHKAVGWMLREVGKRDKKTETDFLKKYYNPDAQSNRDSDLKCRRKMPRTMLRYAIEKFPENERQKYLKGKV